MSESKTGWGGARAGAGRIPLSETGAAIYTLGIRMPAELRAKLEAAAAATGQKKTDIARQAIEKYLENYFQNIS